MTLVAWAVLGLTLVYQTWGQGAIRGLPCIERLNQLHCLDRGDSYPESRIESFIDLNKALTRRMFGEFQPPGYFFDQPRVKRSSNATVGAAPTGRRHKRQSVPPPPKIEKGSKHLVDSCESKIELVTPYWAANSAGKIRAVVNTKHFPQAIHQEICKGTTTSHCGGSCMCEQKYTFHRLLAYDPDNDCKGIFIDWFLFPSCCACRCPP
ncbi:protein spaetzle 3-like isoform X2 [Pollicipes pollicipes]|uniref:protein spaetzle 3-like isoform X2 n=1 Tax=Pollicipes pollicipes TaxID=41117 RepID=UPI001884BB12|nr:protein spaetzle 3-like isoform X2 [Pollicipes pollicipes]